MLFSCLAFCEMKARYKTAGWTRNKRRVMRKFCFGGQKKKEKGKVSEFLPLVLRIVNVRLSVHVLYFFPSCPPSLKARLSLHFFSLSKK